MGGRSSGMSEASATVFVARRSGVLAWIADVGGRPISRPLREAVAILAICPILLGAALWNGFPLIFYDTGAYIFQSFGDRFVPERSPVYSLFIRWAGGGESLGLVASVQVVMIAFVLAETAPALAPRGN